MVPHFFGVPMRSKDMVFVVDISGSVGLQGLKRMREELIHAIEGLGSDVHIAVLFFSDEVHMWKPKLVRATPQHKGELAYFLRGIAPGKKTDVFTPVHAGLQLVRKRVEQKEAAGEAFRTPVSLIVVSDGRNNVDRTPPHIVADKLDRLDLSRTVVHAIVVGGQRPSADGRACTAGWGAPPHHQVGVPLGLRGRDSPARLHLDGVAFFARRRACSVVNVQPLRWAVAGVPSRLVSWDLGAGLTGRGRLAQTVRVHVFVFVERT